MRTTGLLLLQAYTAFSLLDELYVNVSARRRKEDMLMLTMMPVLSSLGQSPLSFHQKNVCRFCGGKSARRNAPPNAHSLIHGI